MEKVKVEGFREKPVGTGPYKLVEYQLNSRIVLERNDGYWGPKPKLKRITFDIVKDPSARVAAVQSGQVDLHRGVLDGRVDAVNHSVRQRREGCAEAQFVQQPQRARVHRVAAEVTKEVGVLLHHGHVDAGPGEQQAEHHPSGSATHDQARRWRRWLRFGARHPNDRRVGAVTGILNWWDGVELWLSGLGFVAQTALVMPVVLLLAYGMAVVLDGAFGNGIRLLQRLRRQDEDRS